MLVAYRFGEKGLEEGAGGDAAPGPDAAWIDLLGPTSTEEQAAETFIGADVPSREETQEIEFSSRFYSDSGAVFMTASVLTGVHRGEPVLVPFTLVVADERIVTIRYDDLTPLKQFVTRAVKPGSGCTTAPAVFIGLVEAIVDRVADVLERISADVDRLNQTIFTGEPSSQRRGRQLSAIIGLIGLQGDLAAKSRESLASLERLVQYAGLALPPAYGKSGNGARLKLTARDIRSLEDHVEFLSNKITFLLDATLGLISVEQNEVIRVLTVAATVFFPPTLIGTVYGMNFEHMPELSWPFGYALAVAVMVVSAITPFVYFRRRGWL
jgi:magnesium transporter